MHEILKYGLESFEMLHSDGAETGLVEVAKPELIDSSLYSIEEIIAIEDADNYKADYVYFRRFKDKPSIPQVYIYDYTDCQIENINLIKLHQRLYSSGRVPMFFVFTDKDVRIFNCYEKPAKGNQLIYRPLTTIKLAAKLTQLFAGADDNDKSKFKAFSGKSFDNGTFWENSPFSSHFKFQNSAYENLLTELKQALREIINQNILPPEIARKIMVISILIKYLEERTDDNNNSVFPKENQESVIYLNGERKKIKYPKSFFNQFVLGASCFTDVLRDTGATLKLIEYLAKHFNGGVFALENHEKEELEKCNFEYFASFLEGKLQGNQYVFWRLYSFNDLPVELISNIYEEFLESKPGVVYTPPYLVSFLLDECMPLKDIETDFKVLDPACGSGVFLVGAYRRLIYRWRKNNNWKRPALSILKQLLKDNIFGCDIDPYAVNLSIFSLSLALCDELTPLQIWEDLEFDNLLGENLFANDFFHLTNSGELLGNTFDLVIGNPPFESKLTPAATITELKQSKERRLNSVKNTKVKLPDNQIALLFLEQSVKLCKAGKLVCLIQPSGPFLYNSNSITFRNLLFQSYTISQIIDFTLLRSVLFGNATVATCAVFIRNLTPSEDQGTYHIVVNRTKSSKEKIFFELDSHDFHFIPNQILFNNNFIWKANLVGIGSRLYFLMNKLEQLPKLSDYLNRKSEEGWYFGEGFMRGSEGDEIAPFLTGKPAILSKNFHSSGFKVESLPDIYFIRPRKERLYKGPLCLIKEVIESDGGKLPVAWSDDNAGFDSRIFGISAPHDDRIDLRDLYQYLIEKNQIISFFISITSSQSLISYATAIRADDINHIPFHKDLELDSTEEIILYDFFNHIYEFLKSGEISEVANTIIKKEDLKLYSTAFCTIINSVYPTLHPYETFETDSFNCLSFYFKEKPTIDFGNVLEAENYIRILVENVVGVNLRIIRTIRIYDGNVIFIIKPKKLRYWLQSVAMRDADETFSDLRKQGF